MMHVDQIWQYPVKSMIGVTVEGMSENSPGQNSAFCRIRGCRVRNSVVSVRQNSQPLP